MVAGRPLEYDQEYIEKEADLLLAWMKNESNLFFGKFALSRGYDPSRLHEFGEVNDKFSRTMKMVKKIQEYRLLEKGLYKETDSGLTKFCLINNHDYKNDAPPAQAPVENTVKVLLEGVSLKQEPLVKEKK